jgi:hypothetical protein
MHKAGLLAVFVAAIICLYACTKQDAVSLPLPEEPFREQAGGEPAVSLEEPGGEQILVEEEIDGKLIVEFWEKYINNDFQYPFGKYFWDEFGDMRDHYSLSKTESELLGWWTGVDNGPLPSHEYYFYPNKLFAIDFEYVYSFFGDERKYVRMAFGVWYIENNVVKARIYSFKTVVLTGDPYDQKPEFIMVSPYEIDIVDFRHFVSLGYFTEYFNDFVLPVELEDRIITSGDAKFTYLMARLIYTINVATNQGKNYGHLVIAPELAKEDLSGMDIVTNPELLKKYFFKNRW